MGNFLSNQRIESMDDTPNAQWTERGVLMDILFRKRMGKQVFKRLKPIQPGSTAFQRDLFNRWIRTIFLPDFFGRLGRWWSILWTIGSRYTGACGYSLSRNERLCQFGMVRERR